MAEKLIKNNNSNLHKVLPKYYCEQLYLLYFAADKEISIFKVASAMHWLQNVNVYMSLVQFCRSAQQL